jgi:MGT family glycosyltransferase
LRNRLGNRLLGWAARPIRRVINEFRAAHRLRPIGADVTAGGEELVQVAQQPAFFDFPRERLPDHFHYTGPWHEPGRDTDVEFPWEKLDGRPVVYASLGTMQNRLGHVFRAIVGACATGDVQLVLALGRRDAAWDGPAPGNAVVVPFAPQLKLLDRAAAVVTHAGLNTVLEALARGRPMVCLPVTNDQPGVARRVEWLGAGVAIKPSRATADRLRPLVRAVLTDPPYRAAADDCRRALADSPGVRGAADVIEKAFATGKRVAAPTP